jgi:hypothetical protein
MKSLFRVDAEARGQPVVDVNKCKIVVHPKRKMSRSSRKFPSSTVTKTTGIYIFQWSTNISMKIAIANSIEQIFSVEHKVY